MFGWRGKKVSDSEHDWICSLSKEERTKEYMKTARERWESCWMIQAADGWKIEHGKNEVEGCVSARHFKEFGKIHRIKGLVDAPSSAVFEQLVHGDNESPAWNPTVAECRTVEVINDNTDIAYNIAREAAGGLVSGRDFVNLRHWKEKEGIMVSLGWSVPHPDMPPTKKHVRAENRPSFWTFETDKEDSNKCHFALYTRIDLRGWLPHYLVEQAMVSVLSNYLVYLRNRMEHLKSNGNLHHLHPHQHQHNGISPRNSGSGILHSNGISPPATGNEICQTNGGKSENSTQAQAQSRGDKDSNVDRVTEGNGEENGDGVASGIIAEMNTLNLANAV